MIAKEGGMDAGWQNPTNVYHRGFEERPTSSEEVENYWPVGVASDTQVYSVHLGYPIHRTLCTLLFCGGLMPSVYVDTCHTETKGLQSMFVLITSTLCTFSARILVHYKKRLTWS